MIAVSYDGESPCSGLDYRGQEKQALNSPTIIFKKRFAGGENGIAVSYDHSLEKESPCSGLDYRGQEKQAY
jgi:hypothetical protein